MKKIIVNILLLVICNTLFSQAPSSSELFDFNKSRNKKTTKGLYVLGAWALANIGTSAYYYSNTKGVDKSFHQMNMMWNGANTFIVVASLLPKQRNDLNLTKTLNWQSNTEAVYIASAALDLVYSTAGFVLTEKAKNDFEQHDKYQGWGNALIYNGGFLFLFDTSMFIAHKRNGKKLYKMMDKINVSAGGNGIKIVLHI
ncbi:hypothetical protein BH10BAC1_BH10BAC1_21250 [soil metagenome]